MCSGKDTFLKCEKILKDYKSEQNPLKMLKGLNECFFLKVASLNLQLCRKINFTTNSFSNDLSTFSEQLVIKENF